MNEHGEASEVILAQGHRLLQKPFDLMKLVHIARAR